jgi:hypothetical protein
MSLRERLQKEREISELQQRNQIESAKVQAFQHRYQSKSQNLKYCPYCGKQLP